MSKEEVQEEKVGLDHLDDETLVEIASLRTQSGDMTTEAGLAFRELARRSGLE